MRQLIDPTMLVKFLCPCGHPMVAQSVTAVTAANQAHAAACAWRLKQ